MLGQPEEKQFYGITEVAALCGLKRAAIHNAFRRDRRKFPNAKLERTFYGLWVWKIPRADVESYLWKSHRLRLEDLEGDEK